MKVAKHIPYTKRAWRQMKRKQLQRVEISLRYLSFGCAYFPGGGERLARVRIALAQLKSSLSAAEWGH